jgi:intergrase/recombinase
MNLCRKIFASYLRHKAGIEPEIVDMLQGRVSQSVLTRHYLVPDNRLKDRVLEAAEQLQKHLKT